LTFVFEIHRAIMHCRTTEIGYSRISQFRVTLLNLLLCILISFFCHMPFFGHFETRDRH